MSFIAITLPVQFCWKRVTAAEGSDFPADLFSRANLPIWHLAPQRQQGQWRMGASVDQAALARRTKKRSHAVLRAASVNELPAYLRISDGTF
jgi:hypothetical protein